MALLDEVIEFSELPEANNNFEALPPGWYNATIASAELKDTKRKIYSNGRSDSGFPVTEGGEKDGKGQYIKLRFNVTGPTHAGRVVFTNINVRNQSIDAERIGRQQLSTIMKIAGLPRIQDTDQLLGLQLQIKLTVQESEQYGKQNDVKGYKAMESHGVHENVRNNVHDDTKAIQRRLDNSNVQSNVPSWVKR